MPPLRAAAVLALVAVGCAEVHAQPRRDAGGVRRRDPGVRPAVGFVRDAPPRGLFNLIDASIPSAFFGAATDDGEDLRALRLATATTAQPTPVQGDGVGGLGPAPSEGRFDTPESLAGIPLPEVRSWLVVAGGWTHRCLERSPEVDPFTLPVRFTVTPDGSVGRVTTEGASEAVQRCLTEGFSHARFAPRAQPVELVARYRYTVRWRRPRAAGDAGVSDARAPVAH